MSNKTDFHANLDKVESAGPEEVIDQLLGMPAGDARIVVDEDGVCLVIATEELPQVILIQEPMLHAVLHAMTIAKGENWVASYLTWQAERLFHGKELGGEFPFETEGEA